MAGAAVVFHRLAVREHRAALRWYARRSAQARDRFEDAVERAVQRVADAPERWPRFGRHHRWAPVGMFPFLRYYCLIDPNQVLVVAVAHGRRRPGYWSMRN